MLVRMEILRAVDLRAWRAVCYFLRDVASRTALELPPSVNRHFDTVELVSRVVGWFVLRISLSYPSGHRD